MVIGLKTETGKLRESSLSEGVGASRRDWVVVMVLSLLNRISLSSPAPPTLRRLRTTDQAYQILQIIQFKEGNCRCRPFFTSLKKV